MPFLFESECHCCMLSMRTGDWWHEKDCWNRWHHGLRDNDWLDKKEFIDNHGGPEEYYRMVEMHRNPERYLKELRDKLESD